MAGSSLPAATAERHPRGLYVLFFAEAWERFSYYGMRALLVLYLVGHLDFAREDALRIYAIYTGLVYFTPLIGGLLADRLLGARKSIIIGGAVMALGHLAMASEPLLYPALGLLIVGNGFFKPNISTLVGGLYRDGDPRRDGGFTIFYMGINVGAFFSPLVCGTLGETLGWHYGFSAAGIGMVLGLLTFLGFQKLIGKAGYPPEMGDDVEPGTPLRKKDWVHILMWTLGSVAFVYAVLGSWTYLGPALDAIPDSIKLAVGGLTIVGTVGGMVGGAARYGKEEMQRTIVIIILATFVIFFFMGFEQAGGTMTLFADTQTDRHLFGFEIPASWFQSINPLAIVVLAPIFSIMWTRLDQSKYSLSTPAKMALGMIVLGLGFVVMYGAQVIAEGRNVGDTIGQVGPLWLTAVYVLHTIGELMLNPIGLSMVTKLAVPQMVSLMMGVWLMSSAIANYLAGILESLVEEYQIPVFAFLIGTSIGAGLILLLISPLLNKWTHGKA